MTDHWCTYCGGINTHNCQYNPHIPRVKIYTTTNTTNTTVVSDNELLRQALEALLGQRGEPDWHAGKQRENAIAALRERLAKENSND